MFLISDHFLHHSNRIVLSARLAPNLVGSYHIIVYLLEDVVVAHGLVLVVALRVHDGGLDVRFFLFCSLSCHPS